MEFVYVGVERQPTWPQRKTSYAALIESKNYFIIKLSRKMKHLFSYDSISFSVQVAHDVIQYIVEIFIFTFVWY